MWVHSHTFCYAQRKNAQRIAPFCHTLNHENLAGSRAPGAGACGCCPCTYRNGPASTMGEAWPTRTLPLAFTQRTDHHGVEENNSCSVGGSGMCTWWRHAAACEEMARIFLGCHTQISTTQRTSTVPPPKVIGSFFFTRCVSPSNTTVHFFFFFLCGSRVRNSMGPVQSVSFSKDHSSLLELRSQHAVDNDSSPQIPHHTHHNHTSRTVLPPPSSMTNENYPGSPHNLLQTLNDMK